jgi:hypothetical protein
MSTVATNFCTNGASTECWCKEKRNKIPSISKCMFTTAEIGPSSFDWISNNTNSNRGNLHLHNTWSNRGNWDVKTVIDTN